jgi:hypothetical protein
MLFGSFSIGFQKSSLTGAGFAQESSPKRTHSSSPSSLERERVSLYQPSVLVLKAATQRQIDFRYLLSDTGFGSLRFKARAIPAENRLSARTREVILRASGAGCWYLHFTHKISAGRFQRSRFFGAKIKQVQPTA